jgi:hypothetical protein
MRDCQIGYFWAAAPLPEGVPAFVAARGTFFWLAAVLGAPARKVSLGVSQFLARGVHAAGSESKTASASFSFPAPDSTHSREILASHHALASAQWKRGRSSYRALAK